MGFRFRKSVNLGPLRLNASKSGLGWSVGGKGYRYTKKAGGGTRTTLSIPGTGLSYTKDSGNGKKKQKSGTSSNQDLIMEQSNVKQHSPRYYTMCAITAFLACAIFTPFVLVALVTAFPVGLFLCLAEGFLAFIGYGCLQAKKVLLSSSSETSSFSPTTTDRTYNQSEVCNIPSTHNTIRTNPTAHNAYIFNAEYIACCRKKFISFDLETTGLSPFSDRIVEISAITFENFLEISKFSTLVNPGRHIPESSTQIHGISDSDVANAPTEFEAIKSFCTYIGQAALDGDTVLVAHNASFDIKFLLYAFSRCGVEADICFQDTLYMCRRSNIPTSNNKLSTVAQYFEIEQKNQHRAADDAKVCGEIFIKLLSQISTANNERFESLTDLEKQLCYWFKQTLSEAGSSTFLLSYSCNSSYFCVNCLYTAFKLKSKAKKPYLLADSGWNIPEGLTTAPAVKSEGEGKIRIFFQSPSDLDPLKPLIVARYSDLYEQASSFISRDEKSAKSAASNISAHISID